ncbi:MAG: hypothetical protein RL033_7803, partial [Pseudomonadota bacterium]
MSAFRPFLRPLVSVVSPVLACLLCACGTAGGGEDGDEGGPRPFTGVLNNTPAGSNAGAGNPGASNPGNAPAAGNGSTGNGSTGNGSTGNGSTGNGSASPGPAVNEGAQNGQVPVAANGANSGASGANGGAGGAGAMGGNPNPTSPSGAAGTGMMPPPNPTPQQPPPVTPTPTPMLPTPPGDAFFFDDFEGGAAGTQPAAWDRWINYTTAAGNALGNPQFALLDNTESFRGNQSIHFHTEAATQPAMLTMRLPQGMNRIYIRAFVMSRIAVGGVAADSVSNHESLIGLRATSN